MANPAPVGPPAKKPKPAPPKPVQVVYLYCENPKCAFHATHVIKSKAEADALDLVCPLTAPDKLVKLELTTVAPVPATAPAAPATGIVLPTAPYGGFMLMFLDDDEASTWERAKQTDPRHDGARYVAELRRYLLRLAFYSATRIGQEPAGKVTMPLVANVLDLKRHLTRFYSVPSSDKPADVKASAATGTGPIYFRSLLHPAEVYNLFRAWEKTLVGGISADRKLAAFGKEWAKRSRAGQTDAALKQLRIDLATSRTTLTNLRARGVALKKEADALKSEVAAAKAKRAKIRPVHTGSATDDANDLDGKLKDLDARIGDAQKRVKDLESELDTLNKTIADLDKKVRAMDPAVTKLERAIATNLEIYLLLRARAVRRRRLQ